MPKFLDILGVKRLKQKLDEKIDNKIDKEEGKGLSSNNYTDLDKDKLNNLPTIEHLGKMFNFKVDKEEGKGLSTNDFTDEDKAKLNNLPDSSGLTTSLDDKVTKEDGKGLSSNDFTDTDKKKLGDLPTNIELAGSLSGKVDKIDGKTLSTNDFTNDEKNKLTGIENSAQVNIIEGVKINNVELAIADKIVDIAISSGIGNGNISVNNIDIPVKGLAALAYKANVSKDDLNAALQTIIDNKAENSDVTTLSSKIDVINGTGVGSIQKAITDAFNAFATDVSNDGVINSYKELVDWASEHGQEANQFAAAIQRIDGLLNGIGGENEPVNVNAAIAKAITDLQIGNYYTKTQVDNIKQDVIDLIPQDAWTSDNDGTGSGLDADLLDGKHAGFKPGEVATLIKFPNAIELVELGYISDENKHINSDHFKVLLKWLYDNYRSQGGNDATYLGRVQPNSQGNALIHIYGINAPNEDGYPNYASGFYVSADQGIAHFGFNGGTYFYRPFRINEYETFKNNVYTKSQVDSKIKFNGIKELSEIDACTTSGYYIIKDPGISGVSTNVYDLLLVFNTNTPTSIEAIRQVWYRVNTSAALEFIPLVRYYNGVTQAWGEWAAAKIDGINIKNLSIPNNRLASASVTPAANSIPITTPESMLPVKGVTLDPYGAYGSIVIKESGWVRVAETNAFGQGKNIILFIGRSYGSTNNESYTFSISGAFNNTANITQLSGRVNTCLIPKIRVCTKQTSDRSYIDIYYNGNSTISNGLFVSGIGDNLICQIPTAGATVPEGYIVTEFETTNGFKPASSVLAPKVCQSFVNGCLVKTNIDVSNWNEDMVVNMRITNVAYKATDIPIDSVLTIFKATTSWTTKLLNNGQALGNVYVIVINNILHVWFKQPSEYMAFSVLGHIVRNSHNSIPLVYENIVSSITNAALPSETGADYYAVVSNVTTNGEKLKGIGLGDNTNLNGLVDGYRVYWAVSGNNCPNKPAGVDAFSLQVITRTSTAYVNQILIDSNTDAVYVRGLRSSTWSDWKKLAVEGGSSDDVPNLRIEEKRYGGPIIRKTDIDSLLEQYNPLIISGNTTNAFNLLSKVCIGSVSMGPGVFDGTCIYPNIHIQQYTTGSGSSTTIDSTAIYITFIDVSGTIKKYKITVNTDNEYYYSEMGEYYYEMEELS